MTSEPFTFGLTLLVDKPINWTSFDVVNKLRYAGKKATGKKNLKVGHAGTLDPLATGLMIVCVGVHTKTIESLMGMDKTYEGTLVLGATTPSYDLETEIDQHFPIPPKDENSLFSQAAKFLGHTEQLPPIFSAKKVDGRKAYLAARKGKSIELRPGNIFVHEFNIDSENYPNIDFQLRCSKGTYVRSLVYDFGKSLGSGAHLTRLNRTEIGHFSLKNALSVDEAMIYIQTEYAKYLNANTI